ncbi:MAG: tRNA ((37)-N6)-threonylcarbamoyltransferase complex ATPase subunit type 1 TsaE [Bacteroidota bacterium]|jgi:tRNA threonylcarbamoyladenosine biosynthesis protein TsaE
MKTFIITSTQQLESIAHTIIGLTLENKVFCLYGNLGAGKTTFVKSVCELLGVEDNISSPTFPIINEYSFSDGKIYHIDLYRLKTEEEARSIGLEEYLFSGEICFIEWPDNFENLLPNNYIKLFIRKLEDDSRVIEIIEH